VTLVSKMSTLYGGQIADSRQTNRQYTSIHAYPPRPAAYDGGPLGPGSMRRGRFRTLGAPIRSAGVVMSKMFKKRSSRKQSKPKEPDHIPRRYSPVRSGLYQTSFALVVLITAVVLTSSAWGFGEQAWRSGGQKRWNIVIVVGAYVAIVCAAHKLDLVNEEEKGVLTSRLLYPSLISFRVSERTDDSFGRCPSRTCLPKCWTWTRYVPF
jgi:hypothetical protein